MRFLILYYAWFGWRSARRALVLVFLALTFFFYCFVNIAMVMGVIPVGGVPLPLVSHGGSAMITMMVSFGVLMSVQVHRDVEFEGTGRDP